MAETIPDSTVDRSHWGPGPWDAEPEDRIEWRSGGFPCLMLRNSSGVWCGYVGVPRGHPAYDKDYEEVDVEVHGGLTYADRCGGHICHTPQPGESDEVFWLGFDTNHGGDLSPVRSGIFLPPWARRWDAERGAVWTGDARTYKTIAYTCAEVERLAAQLAAMR